MNNYDNTIGNDSLVYYYEEWKQRQLNGIYCQLIDKKYDMI